MNLHRLQIIHHYMATFIQAQNADVSKLTHLTDQSFDQKVGW